MDYLRWNPVTTVARRTQEAASAQRLHPGARAGLLGANCRSPRPAPRRFRGRGRPCFEEKSRPPRKTGSLRRRTRRRVRKDPTPTANYRSVTFSLTSNLFYWTSKGKISQHRVLQIITSAAPNLMNAKRAFPVCGMWTSNAPFPVSRRSNVEDFEFHSQ